MRERLHRPAVFLARSGVWDGRQLDLRLVSSTGALVHRRFPCRAPCSFRVDAGDVVVQGPRFGSLRGWLAIGVGAAGVALASLSDNALMQSGGIAVGAGLVGWGVRGAVGGAGR